MVEAGEGHSGGIYEDLICIFISEALFIISSSNVWAGKFEDGWQEFLRRDFAAAFRIWKNLAEDGDRNAQYKIGFMYDSRLGVSQNHKEAARWYRLAANQGEA
jgi:TPR repeat protein